MRGNALIQQQVTSHSRREPFASGIISGPSETANPLDGPELVRPRAIVIGCSTGGPAGLTTVLESLAAPLDIPILVVQHMPPRFTTRFAQNLDRRVETRVVEAEHGMIAAGGTCYVAPGGRHMEVSSLSADHVRLRITDTPAVSFCKPSVEKLFGSAADHLGQRIVAVMLTGMGRDGVSGSIRLADLGCPVLAQDRASSAVWGMPRAVVESGAASDVLPLDDIGPLLLSLATTGFRRSAPSPGR